MDSIYGPYVEETILHKGQSNKAKNKNKMIKN